MPFTERLIELGDDQLTLEEIKSWLKVEHDLDNSILESLREVAVNEAYNLMQNDFEYEDEAGVLVLEPIPFNVKLCCLMFVAYLYQNRGDEPTQMPHNCMRLLYPYKKLVGL
jgi:hypothetical protein